MYHQYTYIYHRTYALDLTKYFFISVRSAVFTTPGDYKYEHAWYSSSTHTSVVFKVEACAEAHVALSKYVGITSISAYEVVIGGYNNKLSAVRSSVSGADEKTAITDDILSCSEPRWFWISWTGGELHFGKGTIVEEDVVISWKEANIGWVEGVGITTARNNKGIWDFAAIPGTAKSIIY